jgi:hypothetical protein
MSGRARAYLALAVIGAAVPLAIGAVFVSAHGLDVAEAGRQLSSTIGILAMADLTIASVVFWVWLSGEARRAGLKRWWPLVAANLLVGLCFALPLFLYLRERRLAPARGAAPAAPAS